MKTKIIITLLIVCSSVIYLSSCNQPHSNDSVTDSSAIENTLVDTPMQSTDPTTNTSSSPIGDTVPLIFNSYEDFLLFATKNEIDSNKYPNADFLLQHYKLNSAAFIDVQKLFNLPKPSSKGWKEEIIMENNYEFRYNVYSTDSSNRLKYEYSITVTYNKNALNRETYHTSITEVNKISDMQGRIGAFVYKTDNYDALYYITNSGYKTFTLFKDNLSIMINFNGGTGTGLTREQINTKCGSVLAGLFAEDTNKVNEALDKMADFVFEAQKNEIK